MPFSSDSGKKFISNFFDKVIRFHQRLLEPVEFDSKHYVIHDYGAGSGTYAKLLNPKLDKLKYITIDAIEIYEPYIEKYNLKELYDNVIQQSAKEFLDHQSRFKNDTEDGGFYHSCAIFGDIIEHMSLEEAVYIHEKALNLYGFTIISIPLGYYPQDEYDGNPYEKHITDNWTHEKVLETFKNVVSSHIENEIGIYICSNKEHIAIEIQKALEPKIGVYIICKNEEEFIERCIKSCTEADQIVIADTGSTDNTMLLINFLKNNNQDLLEKLKVVQISINPWRFDEAKNSALMLLDNLIDIAISLDADEMLEPGWKQELILSGPNDCQWNRCNHRFETYWNWNEPTAKPVKSEHWHDRIHTRHNYLWKLPVHEVLELQINDGEEITCFLSNVKMIQKPDTSKERSSYFELLKISVKERPDLWKSWSFLAQEYLNISNFYESLQCLMKALDCKDSDISFIRCRMANVYEQMSVKDPSSINFAKENYDIAARHSSSIREYQVYAGEFCKRHGFNQEAKIHFCNAFLCNTKTDGYSYNNYVWTDEFEQFLKEQI